MDLVLRQHRPGAGRADERGLVHTVGAPGRFAGRGANHMSLTPVAQVFMHVQRPSKLSSPAGAVELVAWTCL